MIGARINSANQIRHKIELALIGLAPKLIEIEHLLNINIDEIPLTRAQYNAENERFAVAKQYRNKIEQNLLNLTTELKDMENVLVNKSKEIVEYATVEVQTVCESEKSIMADAKAIEQKHCETKDLVTKPAKYNVMDLYDIIEDEMPNRNNSKPIENKTMELDNDDLLDYENEFCEAAKPTPSPKLKEGRVKKYRREAKKYYLLK